MKTIYLDNCCLMNNHSVRTLDDIRHVGIAALEQALGPVDMIRFIQQFGAGAGDYTKKRQAIQAAVAPPEFVKEMKALARKTGKTSRRPRRSLAHAAT